MTDNPHNHEDGWKSATEPTVPQLDPAPGAQLPNPGIPVPPPPQYGVQSPPSYGPSGYGYPPPYPAPPSGGGRTGLIVAGAIAVVLVLGAGVAVGFSMGGDGGDRSAAATTAPETTASATTAPAPTSVPVRVAPGIYSMDAVANACDLVDPTPLTAWSSTPKPVQHHETRPAEHGIGGLLCQIGYTSTSPVDGVTSDEASMSLEIDFTNAGEAPSYDKWKHDDTARAEPGRASGDVTDVGARGYWRSESADYSSVSTGTTYTIGVQDDNISVRVETGLLRAVGEPPVSPDELEPIVRSHIHRALDELKKK